MKTALNECLKFMIAIVLVTKAKWNTRLCLFIAKRNLLNNLILRYQRMVPIFFPKKRDNQYYSSYFKDVCSNGTTKFI